MRALCLKPLHIVFQEGRLYEYNKTTLSMGPSSTSSPTPSEAWTPTASVAPSSDVYGYSVATRISHEFECEAMHELGIKNRKGIYENLKGTENIKVDIDFARDEYVIIITLTEEEFYKHFRGFI